VTPVVEGLFEAELDPAGVRERLGLGEETTGWLAKLSEVGRTEEAPRLPERDDVRVLLARLAAPAEQINEAVTALSAVEADPVLRWLLMHCAQQLIQNMARSRSPEPCSNIAFQPRAAWSLPLRPGLPGDAARRAPLSPAHRAFLTRSPGPR